MMRSTSLALEATQHDKDHYRLNLVVGEVTSRLHEVVAANRRLQQVLVKSTVSPVAASPSVVPSLNTKSTALPF